MHYEFLGRGISHDSMYEIIDEKKFAKDADYNLLMLGI